MQVNLSLNHLKRFCVRLLSLFVFFLTSHDLYAQCSALPSAYYLTGAAASETTNPGDAMVPTNTGTANGFTPTSVLSGTPLYWYSPTFSGIINAGYYTVNLWTNAPGATSNVTVQLGYANANGTGYVSLGSSTADVNLTGGGNHITGYNFNLPVLNLTNKVFVVTVFQANGTPATIVYNDGTDFGSDLTMPVGQTTGCPTWTPTPCGYTSQVETSGTADKLMYLSSIGAAEPANWTQAGFNSSGWSNAVLWTSPTGPGIAGVPWASSTAAGTSNGADKELVIHHFTIPAGATGITATLNLAVDDNSTSTLNGNIIQSDPNPTTTITNQAVRTFPVPGGSITAGNNVLTIDNASSVPFFIGYNFQLVINYTIPCITPTNTPTKTNTPTPTKTNTPTNTFTNTPTNTRTVTPTNTATATFTNTSTNTSTPTKTNTPTPTFTPTPTKTNTPTNTFTPTNTNTPTNSFTNTPTKTNTFTNTNTPTRTPTNTNTPTNTFTNTSTFTPTPTNTNTFTNTNTPTRTPTNTNTPTNTFTNTFTNTDTPTPTLTKTNTPTPTNSFTPTNTPTKTNTPTNTNTTDLTSTATFILPTHTPTPTQTNTPTITNTPTATNTRTFTNTSTFTFTSTNTSTPTNTWTFTNTPTITNTPLFTYTPTNTSTPTNTPTNTNSPTNTRTVTPTNTATATFTFTWTFTPTNSFTATNTPTLTNTPTVTMTFTPTKTPTNSPTPTSTFTWTNSPTPTSTPTFTRTVTSTNTPTKTPTFTNTSTFTSTPTPTSTATFTCTSTPTIPGAYTVIVSVYNSAGEKVKQLAYLQLTEPAPGVVLSANAVTALSGEGSGIGISYTGGLLGNWDGTNAGGNPVLNGVYYVQVASVGPNGQVSSVTQQVAVTRSVARVSALVYNSVGEIVRHLYGSEGSPKGAQMTNVELSSSVVTPGGSDLAGQVQISVKTTGGGTVELSWDGTSDNGGAVTPGVYELEVHWDDGTNGTSNINKSIVVRPGQGGVVLVAAQPNALGPDTGSMVTFRASPGQGLALRFRIYTVAGEFIPAAPGPSGPDLIQYNVSGLASGLYLAEVEGFNQANQRLLRQTVRFTVVH